MKQSQDSPLSLFTQPHRHTHSYALQARTVAYSRESGLHCLKCLKKRWGGGAECVCVSVHEQVSSIHCAMLSAIPAAVAECVLFCTCVCVCVCTYQRSSNIPLRPPPFTNTCIILSGRKGPVSYSFLSSDTSQASEGVAEGLMMPLLKARARLHGMTGPANYLIPPPPPTPPSPM